MKIQDIEAFVAVAETGSINRAAIRLNLTQPATTRRVQNFEALMGTEPLFDRSVKPATLTAFGNYILELSRHVLKAVAELEARAKGAGSPSGNIKMGVAHGLGDMVMTNPLHAFRRSFPNIQLQISSDWSSNLIESIRNRALDCAVGMLTASHTTPPGVKSTAIGVEKIVVVTTRERQSKRKPQRLKDLQDGGWFLNPPGCGCRAALLRSFEQQNISPRIAAEIHGEDLQLSLLARSGGFGLVPYQQLRQSSFRKHLQILDIVDFELSATVSFIRHDAAGRFEKPFAFLIEQMKRKFRQAVK